MTERQLWAPWRIEYITGDADEGCVFCRAAAGGVDELLLERSSRCMTLLNAFPYASGHVMVAPLRHVGELQRLHDGELLELMKLTRRALHALQTEMSPEGFNVGLNLGTVAGAGIADHLHMHALPRWQGDTNFMPVIADTRVLPQALHDTRELLASALERLPPD